MSKVTQPQDWQAIRDEIAEMGAELERGALREGLGGNEGKTLVRLAATVTPILLQILRELALIRIALQGNIQTNGGQLAQLNTYVAQLLDHLEGVKQ